MLWLSAIVLTIATVLVVYDPTTVGLDPQNGLYALWVAVPLGILIVYFATRPKPNRWQDALATFARFDWRETSEESIGGSYGMSPKPKTATMSAVLKQVPALPADLAGILERVGDGRPVAFYELHPKIAYVAIVEADALAVSDYTSIVMKLQAPAPTVEARPLIPTDPAPPMMVGFAKDKEFSARYVVEGSDPKRVRALLSEPLRGELCDLPAAWVHAEGKALAVTLYGDFEVARAMRLVEAADVFFAEYGADGGPSLLEPAGAKKAKKKKKKAPPPSDAGDPIESPA